MRSIILLICFCLFFSSCKSNQKIKTGNKKIYRVSIIPISNKLNFQDKAFSNILNSAIICVLNFTENYRYVDEEIEKYYIYNAMQLAQKIGDKDFEDFLKNIIDIHSKENPGIDIYISGYYLENKNNTQLNIRILAANNIHSVIKLEIPEYSIESMRLISEKIFLALEPNNAQGLENLNISFSLTRNFESYKLYLEGKEEKRKKTIYGYMNAIHKFQHSLKEDGLYLLALNEIIHTLAQISTDLLELLKQEDIISDSKIITEAKNQLKQNATTLNNAMSIHTNAKIQRPQEYATLIAIFDNSPFKKQYQANASPFKNQMELLLLKWEDEKFDRESLVRGQIKKINSGYAPLLITDFFQTLTNSKININDIIRALLKYSKEHPENRYYIHYFKNFSRLIRTLNEFEYMKLNPEASLSYYQLHQEYILYIREYLKVMQEGL